MKFIDHFNVGAAESVARVLRHPELRDVTVEHFALGQLADEMTNQVRLRVILPPSGRYSKAILVPETPLTAKMLELPDGKNVAGSLKGMLATLDGRDGAYLTGISLTRDRPGFIANKVVTQAELGLLGHRADGSYWSAVVCPRT